MPFLGYQTRLRDKPTVDLPTAPFNDLATWHKIAFLYNNKTTSKLQELHAMAARPDLVDRLIKVVKNRNGHRLAGDVEVAKMALSQQDQISLSLNYIEQELETTVRKSDFETAIAPEKEKIVKQIHECLTQANLSSAQIDTLFMTGGTTAIPSIFAACRNAVPTARVVEGDKLGSVGTGLAIDAAVKFGD